MTKPRTFTPEFKAKAARAALQGQKPLAVLCCAHLRSDRIVLRWPLQLLDLAANLFAGQTPAQRDQQKIDALERLLGPLTVVLAAAKKVILAAQLTTTQRRRLLNAATADFDVRRLCPVADLAPRSYS